MIRVLVCGGRSYSDAARVNTVLNDLHAERPIGMIIEGGADGADALAAQWAGRNKVQLVECAADWKNHGRSAGPRRNAAMLADYRPNLVVAFKGGAGTANMVSLARDGGVEVLEVE